MIRLKQQSDKIKGNKHTVLIAFSVFINMLFISLFSVAYAEDAVSVGVVNVTFLMENAPQAEVASSNLKDKFLPQEQKLAEDLEQINGLEIGLKELIVSKENADIRRQKERELRSRKRARSRSLQDFREELRFARDAALDVVQKEVFSAIDEVRKEKNIDIILQDYISASQRVDITPVVLGFLKKKLEIDTKAKESQ
ncbi:MAG: OmpH family outer membrane protein [Cocleimonas sp.]|nr:OmpH family outer membrane protein [Cocleimonas sp.]